MKICHVTLALALAFVVVACGRPPGEILFGDHQYQNDIEIETGYFWLDDVGDVFSGRKAWEAEKLGPSEINRSGAYDFAILIRLRNRGTKVAWGELELKQLRNQNNGLRLGIPALQPRSETWSVHALSFYQSALSPEYLSNEPNVVWKALYTQR